MGSFEPFSTTRDGGGDGSTALASWREGAAKQAILEFVRRVTDEDGTDYVPPAERAAVFDNDGTLWCERPWPIELGFALRRLGWMAEADRSLRERQPWKAAHENDEAWLTRAVAEHYAGDDTNAAVLQGAIQRALAGMTVDAYAADAHAFLHEQHATLRRRYRDCAYRPMIELLRYLEAQGFSTFIAAAGDRDFIRPVSMELYGIPPERVIGGSTGLWYRAEADGGTLAYRDRMDVFDDGPAKPVRIWSRLGRRPVVACGNSNADVPMLSWSGGQPRAALRLLVLHDDGEREYAYTDGAERSLALAAEHDWTVISVRNDWATVFD